jgi:hypothetical protein
MHENLHSRCDVMCTYCQLWGVNFFKLVKIMHCLHWRIIGAVCPTELHIMSHKCVNCSQLSAVTVLFLTYAQRQGLNFLTSTV